MAGYPARAMIVEEGPREGFQNEPAGIATADKIRLIESLAETGLDEINCCSFVDPRRVPQMADAEAVAAGIRQVTQLRYTGLWLNPAGFARARATPLHLSATLHLSASETFALRNSNRGGAELRAQQRLMAARYRDAGLSGGAGYVFTAFGCNYEGEIPVHRVAACVEDLLTLYGEAGLSLEALYLCDTVGHAGPRRIEEIVGHVRNRWPDLPLALHLHDTRGSGLANVLAALCLGVERFDASCGGLGGCPFAGNRAAAGNICTEDLAFMCAEMGIATGLDLDRLIDSARLAERIVGHPLPGKVMKAGGLTRAAIASD
jgi:hydroxymethylglutaryl-CoA lyase